MNTDLALRILAAHDAKDTALRNLRNAAGMAADDSRSVELLEDAGDRYAEAAVTLLTIEQKVVASRFDLAALFSPPDPKPPKAAKPDPEPKAA